MKFILVALSFLFVTSTPIYASWTGWKYERQVDEFDNDVTHYVKYKSIGEEFYVTVSCHENKNNLLRFFGIFIDEVIDHSSEDRIRIKFDSEDPEWFGFFYSDDPPIEMLITSLTKDVITLINKMKTYSTMKIEIHLFRKGRHIKNVHLAGFTQEFNKMPSYCQ